MSLRRERAAELMDRPDADPRQLRRALRDLVLVNRWLGGGRTAVRHVLDLAERVPSEPVRVLDVGTGSADIPLALVRAAQDRGLPVRVIGLDAHPVTVQAAQEAVGDAPEVEVIVGDALALPFAAGAFDIAMCHTTLHHFDERDAERVLREMDRVARYGVVVTDLRRSLVAYLGVRILAATAWRLHPITRHDGPHSVRGAFTAGEAKQLAARSVRAPVRVREEPLFRWSLVVDRTGGRGG